MTVDVRTVTYMLMAEDMERAIGFWREAFGAERTSGDEHWTETTLAGATVAFHGGHDGSENPTGLGIGVADIDAAVEVVERYGGRVIDPPSRTGDEPVVLATCVDMEGNRFTLSQPADRQPG